MGSSDWLELWSEHGFDTEDAVGRLGATPAQLRLAVSLESELSIQGGLSAGHIREETTRDEHGNELVRSYRLNLGGGQA